MKLTIIDKEFERDTLDINNIKSNNNKNHKNNSKVSIKKNKCKKQRRIFSRNRKIINLNMVRKKI